MSEPHSSISADLASLMDDDQLAEHLARYVPVGMSTPQLLGIAQTLASLLADRPEVRRALLGEPHPDVQSALRPAMTGYLAKLAEARAALMQAYYAIKQRQRTSKLTHQDHEALRAIQAAIRPGEAHQALRLLRAAGEVAGWMSVVAHNRTLGSLDPRAAYNLVMAARKLGLDEPPDQSETYRGWIIIPHSLDGDTWWVRWTHPDRGNHIQGPISGATTPDDAIAYAKARIDALAGALAELM